MANNNAPFGFKPTRNLIASTSNFAQNTYEIASSNTHTIGFGDPVKLLATGYIDISLTTDTAILGIFLGCQYYNTATGRQEYPDQWTGVTTTSGQIFARVCDDYNAVFTVQNSASTAITIADVGANINFTAAGTPNTYSGISIAAVDQTTLGTTATLPFRIVALSTFAGNDNTTGYNWVEVKLNSSNLTSTTGQN